MEATEELQKQEITALQSIYADDFIESPPSKAWKGAARLHEFIIRVPHPNSRYASKISFHLNVKFPRTYPTRTHPIFTIVQPIVGLTPSDVAQLTNFVHTEAQKNVGSEMVFQMISLCQEWIESNVRPPAETNASSLASEMQKRAQEEQRALLEQERVHARQKDEQAAQAAAELLEQIKEDAQRKEELQRIERERHKARRRALSDVTERPAQDISLETFDEEIELDGIRFDSVKLFHGRKRCLGMTFFAEPITDDASVTPLPLELHIVTFSSNYYTTNQGRKKLRQVESEVLRLMKVKHENVLRIFAVQLKVPKSSESSRLLVLMEKQPSMTLRDLLIDCDCLREERASDYLAQILTALHAVHSVDLVHRGVTVSSIGLAERGDGSNRKIMKLMKVAFYTKLFDLHKSDPFGPNVGKDEEPSVFPDGWLSRETLDSPLTYTRARDIHAVGIVLLQMLMGLEVIEQFPDPQTALQVAHLSPVMRRLASDMLVNSKKNIPSCLSLLGRLSQDSLTVGRSRAISVDTLKTPMPHLISASPENGYFARNIAARNRQASRWREDWEELELLGRGGYGSVVKARNKLDNRVYAVKKIKLRTMQGDHKIFREVNALSRLSHRFIVRYYTTWLEEIESTSSTASSNSDSDSEGSDDGRTSVPLTRSHSKSASERTNTDPFSIDLDDLGSGSKTTSFPSIHFTNDGEGSSTEDEEDSDGSMPGLSRFFLQDVSRAGTVTPPVNTQSLRTLYIQMEYVERQTLKERIAEGITEEEAWRLFQQIVDALVHMSSLGILHRDIKLTNIFIDSNGDCKVGDFGLATSSLAAVDPSDVSPHSTQTAADMTLEVGTRLYIAPEVLSVKRGPRDHSKADLYSLGIVFFEMNYAFSTGSERIYVLENLRLPEIIFPDTWDAKRTQQRSIITWLLQHDPAERPSALQLSQSSLLPPRVEDEYFKEALQMMTKPDSPHYQSVLTSLFSQTPRPSRGFLYDSEMPEHATLRGAVADRLVDLFRLHGAVDVEIPLLMPMMKARVEQQRQVYLLDRHGEVVTLPANALVPFARLAARSGVTRIKRYHILEIYRDLNILGHPKVSTAAVFDIITPDLVNGPEFASAELINMVNKCLNTFPSLSQNYEIQLSHSQISEIMLNRIPSNSRPTVIDILSQTKSSLSQKRAILLKKGVSRGMVDELEVLSETYDDYNSFTSRLDKLTSSFAPTICTALNELKRTIDLASLSGVTCAIRIRPLVSGRHQEYFKNGICFEVVRRNKRTDILAAGGRYDHLISQFAPPTAKTEPICAFALQIALERITSSLAAFQSASMTNLVKEPRSFGYWSARRCDVYIVSFQPGHLHERLEVAALLWQHGISADLMYETGVAEADLEAFAELCEREGILFTVYPRPRSARRELSDYKVKSVLRGTEYEISRQDLVGWLLQQIAEQKRVDVTTSGVASVQADISSPTIPKESSSQFDVNLMLPGDTKKQRKQTKQIFLDRAFDTGLSIKSAIQSGSMPILAIDVPPAVFDALAKNNQWIEDDEVWRSIATGLPTQHSGYAIQVRDAAARRKSEGVQFLLLFAVKEERVALLSLE